MIRNKGLFAFILLTVIAVVYVIFDFQYEAHVESTKANEALLLNLDKDQINEVEIKRFGAQGVSEVIVLKKSESGWGLTSPLVDLADPGATSDFVEASTLERYIELIKEGDSIDWKTYGLDQPRGQVTYKTNLGKSVTYVVSSQKNYIADVYIRKLDENKVYLASSTWTARVDKQPYDFRDKRVLRGSYAGIESIRVQLPEENYNLKKIDGKWKSLEKPSWNLDQTKAGEIGSMFLTTNVSEFTREQVPHAEDFKKLGLKAKKYEVDLVFTDQKKWKAIFYQNEKKEYYVQTSDPERLVKISTPDGEKIRNRTLVSLRDAQEPFRFTKDQGQKLILYKDDGSKEEFSNEKAENIIRELRKLEVKEFDLKSNSEKLVDFAEIIDQNKQTVFKMSISQVQNKKIIARTNLFDQVFALDEAQIKNLGIEKLFQKDEETKK